MARTTTHNQAPVDNNAGGDRKGSRKAVVAPRNLPEPTFDARIRVGATRAPQITPQLAAAQGPLGELFDSLGKFADGPFAKAMVADRHSDLEDAAKRAVLEGKTIDQLEDKNFISEFYYRSYQGQKQGQDAMSTLAQQWDENAEDDAYDYEGVATSVLTSTLKDLDPDQASNAVNVIRSTLPGMLNKERDRRIEKVQNVVLDTGKEVLTNRNLGLAKARRYEDLHKSFEAWRADSKHLPNWDEKNARLFYASELISYAIENADPQMIPAVSKIRNAAGSNMWENPEVGDTLRKAFVKLSTERSTMDSIEKGKWKAHLDEVAKKGELTEELVRQGEGAGMSADSMSGYVKTNIDAITYHQKLDSNNDFLANGDRALAQGLEPKEWNDGIDRLREKLTDAMGDPSKANQAVASLEAAHGRPSTESKRRLQHGLLNKNPQTFAEAMALGRVYEKGNSALMTEVMGEPGRDRFDMANILERDLGLRPADISASFEEMSQGLANAKAMGATMEAKDALSSALDSNKLPIGSYRGRVKRLGEALVATGNYDNIGDAYESAAQQVAASTDLMGTLGSRLRIDAALIDPRLGDQETYTAYENAGIDWMRANREFLSNAPDVVSNFMGEIPTEEALAGRMEFWPRKDGTTWVYGTENNFNRLMAIIPTQPILDQVHATLTEPKAARIRASAAADAATIQKSRKDNKEFGDPALF